MTKANRQGNTLQVVLGGELVNHFDWCGCARHGSRHARNVQHLPQSLPRGDGMNNAEHEDFLELLRVYRRVTVSGQTLETAVMPRFLWNTKGRLSSLKASVRLTTSTPDDVVLTIVDSVQVGERVQVALGAEFVDNHEYELREMRKITLTVGFLRGDEDFIRDCIGNWYRGVGLTPQQYTNVLLYL